MLGISNVSWIYCNISECKNFIQDFVKEVIVYKTHVELVFNVGFNFVQNWISEKEIIMRKQLILNI